MDKTEICEICQKFAKQRCGGCHKVFYCSKEHQKEGWQEHKKVCKPYKICHDDIIGRYLIASKDIKEGDVVLQEQPLITAPLQITVPVCMGCGIRVTAKNCLPCSKCGWPLCSKKCEHSINHIPECHYTVKRGDKISFSNFDIAHPSYQCIMALRCLYQKKFAPDVWEKLNRLESHYEEADKAGKFDEDRTYIVKFLHEFFELKDEFSEAEILRVCGIAMVNGHEVPLTTPPYVSIFQEASMLEHNCKANCYKTFTPEGKILIIAGMPVEKGDHLSIAYTDTLWPTFTRRKHLLETKFFACTCNRCSDITEYGTYFSALKCQKEKCDGMVLPRTFFEEEIPWTCMKCKNELSSEAADKLVTHIGKDLHAMEKGNMDVCKKFLEYYGKQLPPNHFYMVDVKLALLHLLSFRIKQVNDDVTNEDILYTVQLARDLVDLIHAIAPAERRIKGAFLFELHAALSEMGRRKSTEGALELGELIQMLMDAKLFLSEAIECLKHEPKTLPEGGIHLQAKEIYANLDAFLKTISRNSKTPL